MLHTRSDDRITRPRAPAPELVDRRRLLAGAAASSDATVRAFAWVIGIYCQPAAQPFVPRLGLDREQFIALLQTHFPYFAPPQGWLAAQAQPVAPFGPPPQEFSDLLQLLLDHRAVADERHRNTAHLVATACMGSDHLWQDLGLPDRKALSVLLSSHFPALAAKNTGDMKWKKFFYKQLCEREGINACKAPSCSACCDYVKCFGAEE